MSNKEELLQLRHDIRRDVVAFWEILELMSEDEKVDFTTSELKKLGIEKINSLEKSLNQLFVFSGDSKELKLHELLSLNSLEPENEKR